MGADSRTQRLCFGNSCLGKNMICSLKPLVVFLVSAQHTIWNLEQLWIEKPRRCSSNSQNVQDTTLVNESGSPSIIPTVFGLHHVGSPKS